MAGLPYITPPVSLHNIHHTLTETVEHSTSPVPEHSRTHTPQRQPNIKGGSSTAVEPTTPTQDEQDPIRRNPAVTTPAHHDEENQRRAHYNSENDPYALSSKLKTEGEIDTIRTAMVGRRNSFVDKLSPIALQKRSRQAKRVGDFYKRQNENIERLLKPVDDHRQEAKDTQEQNAFFVKLGIYGSLAGSILLVGLQLVVAVKTGSLSLFTILGDAIMDPLSSLLLVIIFRNMEKVDPRRFPSGKARFITAGNIAFSFIMFAVSMIIISFSARELSEGSATLTKDYIKWGIFSLVIVAWFIKLGLFLYCYRYKPHSSQIETLWEDHRNDLMVNGTGIITSILGAKVRWWFDAAGALSLSVLIIYLWLRRAWKQFLLLIGESADPEFLQLITYISMTHSPRILAIDTVRAYTSGPRLIVEVDVVMDPEDTLRETHDICEELQTKLESLPDVERCFVHCDWDFEHKPEHSLKKEL